MNTHPAIHSCLLNLAGSRGGFNQVKGEQTFCCPCSPSLSSTFAAQAIHQAPTSIWNDPFIFFWKARSRCQRLSMSQQIGLISAFRNATRRFFFFYLLLLLRLPLVLLLLFTTITATVTVTVTVTLEGK